MVKNLKKTGRLMPQLPYPLYILDLGTKGNKISILVHMNPLFLFINFCFLIAGQYYIHTNNLVELEFKRFQLQIIYFCIHIL